MRFIIVALVAALMVGSVALCQFAVTKKLDVQLTRDVEAHDEYHDADMQEPYRVELTFGFSASEDPFALSSGGENSKRLMIQQGGKTLLTWTDDIPRGNVMTVSNLLAKGDSLELFIEAVPSPDDAERSVPLRVQLFQGERLCDDETIWSEGYGQPVASVVKLGLNDKRLSVDRGLSNAGE